MNLLPVRRPHQLRTSAEEHRWLIEGLWGNQAVGIVGGEPKCCKSFLALDLAISVASGAPCLRRFPPRQTGPVLLFAAEDGLPLVRNRLEGLARAARVAFDRLDIHVICVPSLRLDLAQDQARLRDTIEALHPRLLVLDPFVRLHRIDENAAAEVAPLLGFLRGLQRRFGTAVLLVHHARKGAAHVRAGQALRGSSEFHAWGDSNLYLRRRGDTLRLSIEHRAAPPTDDLVLELQAQGSAISLHVVDRTDEELDATQPTLSLCQRIEQALAASPVPLTRRELRQASRMRTQSLGEALTTLTTQGRVLKTEAGYRLADR
jgi:hypothetical protein